MHSIAESRKMKRLSDCMPKPRPQFTELTHTYLNRRHFARGAGRSNVSGTSNQYRRLIANNNQRFSAGPADSQVLYN